MPTYEYVCSSCQNEWEFEQSMKDAALTECPRCKAQTARRQISRGTGFILKGGGWYSDLYSSSSNKATPSGGENAGSSSGTSPGAPSATTGDASAPAPAATPAPAAGATPSGGKSDSSSST
jgi:putative FmdB family regulatory protein